MIAPVVEAGWLRAHPDVRIADVRWYLDGRSGLDAYRLGHLPGAVFVDLNTALAAAPSADLGRHPLPEPEVFAAAMSAAGISNDSVVVAYDDAGGSSAGRMVWMLRNVGVQAAVLNGGIGAWDGELESGDADVSPALFAAQPWDVSLLADIDAAANASVLVDARAPERYRGDSEPADPQAGHIPGAINLPFAGNLTCGRFKSPDDLRQRFAQAGIDDASQTVFYCGSGVTACHDLLAAEYAGLGRGRLFPGSWSQYSASGRAVATGEQP